MIHVIATIDLKPGCREQFLRAFHELVPDVKRESGCVEYLPTVDIQTPIDRQPPVRPDAVVVVEKWESIEALQAHLKAPHMDDYRQKVKDLVSGSQLRILTDA
jgi:quinol monooxygenase YgiN